EWQMDPAHLPRLTGIFPKHPKADPVRVPESSEDPGRRSRVRIALRVPQAAYSFRFRRPPNWESRPDRNWYSPKQVGTRSWPARRESPRTERWTEKSPQGKRAAIWRDSESWSTPVPASLRGSAADCWSCYEAMDALLTR